MSEGVNKSGSCGVLTISDRGSREERPDTSGPALKTILVKNGFEITAYKINLSIFQIKITILSI